MALVSAGLVYEFVQAEDLGAYSSFSATLDTGSGQVLLLDSHTIHCFTVRSLFSAFAVEFEPCWGFQETSLCLCCILSQPPMPASAPALSLVLAPDLWSGSTVFTVLGPVG